MKLPCLILLCAALVTGCGTTARQNITSTVDTGIGLSLKQNPQTQMYELKAGYIRSQFYSVPTGKSYKENGDPDQNDADKSPEMVAGIRMHSGIENLILGMDVSESFAIGKTAVMSPAATAMYVANAESDAKATAAAAAVQGQTSGALMKAATAKENRASAAELDRLLSQPLPSPPPTRPDGTAYADTAELARELAQEVNPDRTMAEIRIWGGEDLTKLIKKLKEKLNQ